MLLRVVFGLRSIYFRKKARYLVGLERLVKVAGNTLRGNARPFNEEGGKALRLLLSGHFSIGMILVIWLMANPSTGKAQESEDLRAKTQNPVGAMISVPLKNTLDFGAPNGTAYFLNIQPVIPVTVGDWNLINRVILPIVHVGGFIAGTPGIPKGQPGDGATGLGDTNYSVFLSPASPGKVIWGIGPSINFPTATDDQLGSGKWSEGSVIMIFNLQT